MREWRLELMDHNRDKSVIASIGHTSARQRSGCDRSPANRFAPRRRTHFVREAKLYTAHGYSSRWSGLRERAELSAGRLAPERRRAAPNHGVGKRLELVDHNCKKSVIASTGHSQGCDCSPADSSARRRSGIFPREAKQCQGCDRSPADSSARRRSAHFAREAKQTYQLALACSVLNRVGNEVPIAHNRHKKTEANYMTTSSTTAPPNDGLAHKFQRMLRDKGGIGSLSHLRTVALHRAHEYAALSAPGDNEAIPTTGKIELDELTIDSSNKATAVHYAPTPKLVFKWLHRLLPDDRANTTFIDVGAGLGRIVMMAMEYNYARVIGVEFAAELAAQARTNLAARPPSLIKADRGEIVHGDATIMTVPAGPCVFYLFNPFGADVLTKFLANALSSHTDSPRPMTFIYVNPVHADVFEASKLLRKVSLPATTRLQLALLSPYSATIYKTN